MIQAIKPYNDKAIINDLRTIIVIFAADDKHIFAISQWLVA